MSTLKKPGASLKSASTSRIGPINGSRSSTPTGTGNAAAKKGNNAGASSSLAIIPPSMPATGKQNLLDKERKMVEFSSPDDKCPACASDRFLNPALRLLVSKCYHKMCESCIDRLFTLGPGPCPICGQIIRKTQFTPQTYEDLNVEKEVIIRRRIAKIFNKTQEDFPDLTTYNNYLEEVEDLTFNLINAVDLEETDRRILAYQRENAEQIDTQASQEERRAEFIRLQDEEERKLRTERAAEFARQDELDRIEKEKDEKELIKALEAGEGSADKIIKKQKAVALKRSSARMASNNFPPNTETGRPSLLSKYLQFNKSSFSEADKQDALAPEDPISDYDQNWYDYRDLFKIRATSIGYRDQASEDLLSDTKKLAGGFDIAKSVWERAARSAVMGLWVAPLGIDSTSSMNVD